MLVKDAVEKLLSMDQEAKLLRADNSGGSEAVYDIYEEEVTDRLAKDEKDKKFKVVVVH